MKPLELIALIGEDLPINALGKQSPLIHFCFSTNQRHRDRQPSQIPRIHSRILPRSPPPIQIERSSKCGCVHDVINHHPITSLGCESQVSKNARINETTSRDRNDVPMHWRDTSRTSFFCFHAHRPPSLHPVEPRTLASLSPSLTKPLNSSVRKPFEIPVYYALKPRSERSFPCPSCRS